MSEEQVNDAVATEKQENASENGGEDETIEEYLETDDAANGTETDKRADGEDEDPEFADNEVYQKLRDRELKPKVAVALIRMYESTDVSPDDLDDRAIDMLRSFEDHLAEHVIDQMKKANLLGVQNHSQFMMSMMRVLRDKVRQMGPSMAMKEPLVMGPAYDAMKAILDRTGYSLEVTNGQRKYGGPPPDWDGPATGPAGAGHEIYIGKIPNDIYEDTLIPLFEEVGKIWDLRLMMDPLTGMNRRYAFLTFCEKSCAAEAAKKFDGHEIQPGKTLKVNVSVANTRLFIGNIPKTKSKEEILAEFKEQTEGVVDCIVYTSPDAGETRKNRGFCFLDFVDHKSASDAKRKIHSNKLRAFNCDLVVDWAEQQEEPDEETMAKVKVLYVRNLKEAVTEEQLKEMFGAHGEIDHVKKIKDYAFVHFNEREPCVKAMEALNGTVLEGVAIEISLAKPQGDKKKTMRGRGRGFGNNYGYRGGYGNYGGGYGNRDSFGSNRGGGRGGSSYGAPRSGSYGGGYGGGAMAYGGYGGSSYDPYASTGYTDMMYGSYGGSYGGGYESYSGGYGGGMESSYGGGYGGGYGSQMRGSRGSRGGSNGFQSRGSGGRGRGMGRGNGGGRGGKRPSDMAGGPASKQMYAGNVM